MTKSNLNSLAGKICVWTCDHLNGQLAIEVCAQHNLRVEVLFPKQTLPEDAVAQIIDHDFLGLDYWGRRRLLDHLKVIPPRVPTALFGYECLTDSNEKNVVIGRYLDSALISRLLALVVADPAEGNSIPSESDSGRLDEDELARIRIGSDGGPNCD